MCHTSLLSNAAYILVDKLHCHAVEDYFFQHKAPKMGDKGATKIDDVRDDSEIYTNKKIFFFILLQGSRPLLNGDFLPKKGCAPSGNK